MNEMDEKAINTLRVLSSEAIDKAKSGHPGLPLGAAPILYTLYAKHLKHNPKNPDFFDRDRFVLSAGHGSILQYTILHMFGYDVTMHDIMNFRQLNSKTPGHPEVGHTVGIETSTGPLGQGIANAVGFAIAESYLASKFNKGGMNIVDHYTYAFSGDGCMQEGIEYEAASLAGTLKLSKLIVFYDKNNITIEGDINTTFSEDVAKRHESQGWNVLQVENGNDVEAISAAITLAKQQKNKPSLIIVKTKIGYGSSLEGSADCHGAPLGESKTKELRKKLDIKTPPFTVSDDVKQYVQNYTDSLAGYEENWKKIYKAYKRAYPELAAEFEKWQKGKFLNAEEFAKMFEFKKADATRNISFNVLNKLSEIVPNLIGGSADLAPSNKTNMTNREYYSVENRQGSNVHFGIREHAMAAIVNGMQLHGGLQAYCSTFFVFSDYMKNAMRMSAIMELPVIYILTHDSIGVGEDGATHQPVEQLVSLRSIPNMKVFRPCNGSETVAAWICAMSGKNPTSLVLTRQNLPHFNSSVQDALCGGYILSDSSKPVPDMILLASGSEVQLAMDAKKELMDKGIDARVVSMPSLEVFESQSSKYRENVLPSSVRARVAVEAGTHHCFDRYVGLDGAGVYMNTFGASAPSNQLFEIYGFSAQNIVNTAVKVFKAVNK